MKITVIGRSNMGSAFVRQLSRHGHEVRLVARDAGSGTAIAPTWILRD